MILYVCVVVFQPIWKLITSQILKKFPQVRGEHLENIETIHVKTISNTDTWVFPK